MDPSDEGAAFVFRGEGPGVISIGPSGVRGLVRGMAVVGRPGLLAGVPGPSRGPGGVFRRGGRVGPGRALIVRPRAFSHIYTGLGGQVGGRPPGGSRGRPVAWGGASCAHFGAGPSSRPGGYGLERFPDVGGSWFSGPFASRPVRPFRFGPPVKGSRVRDPAASASRGWLSVSPVRSGWRFVISVRSFTGRSACFGSFS
jgi:hypothetical protein